MVTSADFLIEKEDVVLEVLVQTLELSDLIFEVTATIVSSSELFSPLFLLALVGAHLRSPTGVRPSSISIRVTVLNSHQLVRHLESRRVWTKSHFLLGAIEVSSLDISAMESRFKLLLQSSVLLFECSDLVLSLTVEEI